MKDRKKLNILYTKIGRGHPFYLDGLVKQFRENYATQIKIEITDVFSISRGYSLWFWKLVRYLYKAGSQGGLIGKLYGTIRKKRITGRHGLIEKILARDIRKYISTNRFPTLVAHPVLVPMLSDLVPVYYQHGEIAVPDEAIVTGAAQIAVPLKKCEDVFLKSAIHEKNLFVSGLCIEDKLAKSAHEHFQNRIKRFQENGPLTGGFLSSGAEPVGHIRKLILSINSIKHAGYRGIVLCKSGGILEKVLTRRLQIKSISLTDNPDQYLESEKIISFSYSDRDEENGLTYKIFRFLDYFVAPSHERTNWAVGLGLPLFILHPIIGTFSPLNREFLLKEGVAVDLETEKKATGFASLLQKMKEEGILELMVQNGFNKFDINGFSNIAEFITNCLTKT